MLQPYDYSCSARATRWASTRATLVGSAAKNCCGPKFWPKEAVAADEAAIKEAAAEKGAVTYRATERMDWNAVVVLMLKEGTGKSPTVADKIDMHYSGALLNGTVFDEHLKGAPITFPLNGLIYGMQIGLAQLKEGAKAKITIPFRLGYVEAAMAKIPPYSTLVFTVELVAVK